MKATVVIGANYGDEGKGLTVDYLARQQAARGQAPLVVRFNGGAQAGHTVLTPEGETHVFHHIGAGSFVAGSRTYLSSQFIVNPYVLHSELIESRDLFCPRIYTHPQCRITTVFDMAINSLAELSRGDERHGSCGMGINETVTRNAMGFPLTLLQVQRLAVGSLAALLQDIAERWVPQRLEALGLGESDLQKHSLYADALTRKQNFVGQAEYLKTLILPLSILDRTSLAELIETIQPGQDVIFEGAQGLALDEELGTFPYVTRSICGLPSALAVGAFELKVTEFQPIYVTRSYLTRHGAGPLPAEDEMITDRALYDMTNIENMWQGQLRKAPLNTPQLKSLIEADVLRTAKSQAVTKLGAVVKRPQLMLTCLDQLGAEVTIMTSNGLTKLASADLPLMLARELGREMTITLCSYGPTAHHVNSWM